MSIVGDLLWEAASVVLGLLTREMTPTGVIEALSLVNLAAAYSAARRMLRDSPTEHAAALAEFVTLWMLSSASIVLCTRCIILLHLHGIH